MKRLVMILLALVAIGGATEINGSPVKVCV